MTTEYASLMAELKKVHAETILKQVYLQRELAKQGAQIAKHGSQLSKLAPLLNHLKPLLRLAGIALNILGLIEQIGQFLVFAKRLEELDRRTDTIEQGLFDVFGKSIQKLQALERQTGNLDSKITKTQQQTDANADEIAAINRNIIYLNNEVSRANAKADKALEGISLIKQIAELQTKKILNLNNVAAEAKSNARKALIQNSKQQKEIELLQKQRKSLNDQLAEAKTRIKEGQSQDKKQDQKLTQLTNDLNSLKANTGVTDIKEQIAKLNESLKQTDAKATTALEKAAQPGPKGDKGDRGERGAIGAPGIPGAKGEKGEEGKRGAVGAPGKNGLNGKDGKNGLNGKDGKNGLNGKDGKDGKDVNEQDVNYIKNALAAISLRTIPIPPMADKINSIDSSLKSLPNSQAFKNGVSAGVCQTLQPGGCNRKANDALQNGLNQNNSKLDLLNAALGTLDLYGTAQLNTKMDDALERLGPKMQGGLSGGVGNLLTKVTDIKDFLIDKFNKAWKATGMDRVVSLLTMVAALHNAAMLSRNLGETLLETTESVLQAVQGWLPDFLKDPDGQPMDLDLSELFGTKINQLMISLLGADNYAGLRKSWLRANRILSTTANMLDATRSMINATTEGVQVVGSWVAKIGNGLQGEGILSDNTFPWMDESPDFKRFGAIGRYVNQLEDLENAAESVQQLAEANIEFVQSATELTKESQELVKLINNKGLEKEEEELTKNIASQSPEIGDADVVPGD